MAKDMAIVATKCKWGTVPKLSNGAIPNGLQWPLT